MRYLVNNEKLGPWLTKIYLTYYDPASHGTRPEVHCHSALLRLIALLFKSHHINHANTPLTIARTYVNY